MPRLRDPGITRPVREGQGELRWQYKTPRPPAGPLLCPYEYRKPGRHPVLSPAAARDLAELARSGG